MVHTKGVHGLQMATLLPFLMSVAVLATAIQSTIVDSHRTSSVRDSKTDGDANIPISEGGSQFRVKRSQSISGEKETVSGKGISVSKGKESLGDAELRWQRTGNEVDSESRRDDQLEGEGRNLEEVFDERGRGILNGRWIVKDEALHDGIKPSGKFAYNATESDQKRKGFEKLREESSRGINRFLSVGWSKSKSAQSAIKDPTPRSSSRSRRDLRALKRMLDDVDSGLASDNLPEEEGQPEVNDEEEPGVYDDDNAESPRIGESLSGDTTRRQDFSKRPKYYPDWGPKRTWRINMMRVWGKRHLADYDRNHAL